MAPIPTLSSNTLANIPSASLLSAPSAIPSSIGSEDSSAIKTCEFVPASEEELLILLETHAAKRYYSGLVYKKTHLSPSGAPTNGDIWAKSWMELTGNSLVMYPIPDALASFNYRAHTSALQFAKNESDPSAEFLQKIKMATPLVMNVANIYARAFPVTFKPNDLAPPTPYTNHFCLSSDGSDISLFSCRSGVQVNEWLWALRLSVFEAHKISLCQTWPFISTPAHLELWNAVGVKPFDSLNYRLSIRLEGIVNVKLPYTSEFKSYFWILTSENNFGGLFGKQKDLSKRGTIFFYDSRNGRRRNPLFSIDQVVFTGLIFQKGNSSSAVTAGLQGVFHCEGQLESVNRNFDAYVDGYQEVKKPDSIMNLISGKDWRPFDSLQFELPTSKDLAQWIVSILCAFSIHTDVQQSMTELGLIKKQQEWRTWLYFSVDEIGGIPFREDEARAVLDHYLVQKIDYAQKEKLRGWSAHVLKGVLERKIMDAKIVQQKIKSLEEWTAKAGKILIANGIRVDILTPLEAAQAACKAMPGFEDCLMSMISLEQRKTARVVISEDEDGDGSESLSEGAGSQSEEESGDDAPLHVHISNQSRPKQEIQVHSSDSETDSGEDDAAIEANRVFVENSLLHTLATDTKVYKPDGGPLINQVRTEQKEHGAQKVVFAENSLLHNINRKPFVEKANSLNGYDQQGNLAGGSVKSYQNNTTLLGNVKPIRAKPKMDGLLGQVLRRDNEKWTNQKVNDVDLARTQALDVERLKERQALYEQGQFMAIDLVEQLMQMLQISRISHQTNLELNNDLLKWMNIIGGAVQTQERTSMLLGIISNNKFSMPPLHPMNMLPRPSSGSMNGKNSSSNGRSMESKTSSSVKSTSYATESDEQKSASTDSDVSADDLSGTEDGVSSQESSSENAADEHLPLAIMVKGKAPNQRQAQKPFSDDDLDEKPLLQSTQNDEMSISQTLKQQKFLATQKNLLLKFNTKAVLPPATGVPIGGTDSPISSNTGSVSITSTLSSTAVPLKSAARVIAKPIPAHPFDNSSEGSVSEGSD